MKYPQLAVSLIVALLTTIIIAFAIHTSNQKNLIKARELRAVEEIVAELDYYKFMDEYGGGRMKLVIEAAEQLLSAIRDPKVQLSKEVIELELHKLTWIWLSATPTTAYVALNTSGDFSLISSKPLRSKFAQFSADQEKLLQFEAIQARFVDQQLRPFLNRHMDRTTIDTYQFGATLRTQNYSSPFPNTNASLLQNREFANLLTDLLFFTRRLFLPYSRMQDATLDIEDIIKKEYPSIAMHD